MRTKLLILVALFLFCVVGCGSAYQKFGWNAEDFFDDAKVVALCKAIQSKNIKQIDKLVSEGADVNAKGKGNMTPLLWAFTQKIGRRLSAAPSGYNTVVL